MPTKLHYQLSFFFQCSNMFSLYKHIRKQTPIKHCIITNVEISLWARMHLHEHTLSIFVNVCNLGDTDACRCCLLVSKLYPKSLCVNPCCYQNKTNPKTVNTLTGSSSFIFLYEMYISSSLYSTDTMLASCLLSKH